MALLLQLSKGQGIEHFANLALWVNWKFDLFALYIEPEQYSSKLEARLQPHIDRHWMSKTLE